MPKRISPKFCARGRSQIQKLSYVVPNPSAKLGLREPWPECQEIDRRLKQNITSLIKVSTLLAFIAIIIKKYVFG